MYLKKEKYLKQITIISKKIISGNFFESAVFLQQLEYLAAVKTLETFYKDTMLAELGNQPTSKKLEIGPGPEGFLRDLAQAGGEVYALEIASQMIDEAKTRLADINNIEYHIGDIGDEKITTKAGFADFNEVLIVRTLQHVNEVSKALKNIYKMMAPGGRLVCIELDWTTLNLVIPRARSEVTLLANSLPQILLNGMSKIVKHTRLALSLTKTLEKSGFESVKDLSIRVETRDFETAKTAIYLDKVLDNLIKLGGITQDKKTNFLSAMKKQIILSAQIHVFSCDKPLSVPVENDEHRRSSSDTSENSDDSEPVSLPQQHNATFTLIPITDEFVDPPNGCCVIV